MKIRKSELKTLVEEVMNEKNVQIYGNEKRSFTNKAGLAKQDPKKMAKGSKAQFGGEVIDYKDLPKSAQKKVESIEKILKLGKEADAIEDDLRGKYIYVVFKNLAWGSKKEISFPVSLMMKIGKMASAGVVDMKVIGQDVAFGIAQK